MSETNGNGKRTVTPLHVVVSIEAAVIMGMLGWLASGAYQVGAIVSTLNEVKRVQQVVILPAIEDMQRNGTIATSTKLSMLQEQLSELKTGQAKLEEMLRQHDARR